MTPRILALAASLIVLGYAASTPLLAADAVSAPKVDAVYVEADLPAVLKMLASSETPTIDNRVRRPLRTFRLTSRKALSPEQVSVGLTELLLLRGVAVSRGPGGLMAEDTPDPSETIVLAVRDKPLSERTPRLLESLRASEATPVRFSVADMAVVDLLQTLQLLTGCSLLIDDPLPQVRFSSADSTRSTVEILGEIDAFLVKNGIYLVEHDAHFVKVVCAPALLTNPYSMSSSSQMDSADVKERMERVAAEIRARRERRIKQAAEASEGTPPPPASP